MGAVAEYDKAMIVTKLRVARERTKARTGRCEGRKPFGFHPDYPAESEALRLMRSMRSTSTLQEIASALDAHGLHPRKGVCWYPKTIARILLRDSTQVS